MEARSSRTTLGAVERNKWILVGTAAALLCGCDAKVKDDDGLGVGAKLSVDYLGDSDVVGFHYLIERVSCSPGDPIEPYAFEALVDLQDQLAPGGVTLLDVFDDASGHVFADIFVTLDPGCYDVTATPVSEMDMDAGTWTPSDECSVAEEDGVEVVAEATTEVPPMISQCGGEDPTATGATVALNHPPEFELTIDDRFGFECEILEVCAAVSDPDNDPLELIWSQSAGDALFEPISVGPLTETVYDGGRQHYEQCATFVSDAVGDYAFDITVYDLLADGTRIEDSLDGGLESNATTNFPLYTSRGVEPTCVAMDGSTVPLGDAIDRAPGCAWQDAAAYYCDPANAADAGFPLAETCPGGVFDPAAAFPACEAVMGDIVWSDFRNEPDADDDQAADIAVGLDGVYVCGTEDHQNVGSGRTALVTKYDFDGTMVWEATPFAGGESYCHGIVVGSDGNPVLAGMAWIGQWSARVDKLAASTGAQLWTQTYSDGPDDRFFGIGLADNDDVVPVGSAFGGGQTDLLAQRYDTNGGLLWTSTIGIDVFDAGYSAAVDAVGDVYVAGNTDDNGGTAWGMLYKLNGASGAPVWVDIENGISSIESYPHVDIDPTDDMPVVAGFDVNAGSDIVLRKYDPSGAVVWTQTHAGAFAFGGFIASQGGLAFDDDGTFYFAGTIDQPNRDIWVRQFDGADGSALWERTIDGFGAVDDGRAVALSADSIYLTATVDTGPSDDIGTYRLVK